MARRGSNKKKRRGSNMPPHEEKYRMQDRVSEAKLSKT
jgi:hypothetical protein